MASLDANDKLKLLSTMLTSRYGDLREQSLIRQGKGWFHVSGMGHEALSVAGYLLKDGDFFAGYYRDRPIALARGISNYELALSFFAKRSSASGGKQMPAHYSSREKGILSIASVVGASLLPATGLAWGIQLDGKQNVVITTVGDAGTRQGDFYEAIAFAIEKNLPVIFLVEDNGIGISSVTKDINPLALKLLEESRWQKIDGCDVDEVFEVIHPAIEKAREGEGPQFIWCKTERISSHSSADDHRKYRSEKELEALTDKDPINRLKSQLIDDGVLSPHEMDQLEAGIEQKVRDEYARASGEHDPIAEDLMKNIYGPSTTIPSLDLSLPLDKCRMVDSINATFRGAIENNSDCVFFGQDIEDPKGGVFSLTKGLSTDFPENVFNSPLAESTIFGVAIGLAAYGKRPVFEIQFADYIWPGFNQLVTHLSTLHWRSNGEWSAPAVIYAPCGAYLPGGALWHSQTNESALAHFPGIQIAIPSTPEDAAGLFWTAIHDTSPTIMLIPKHLMWHPHQMESQPQAIPFGKARISQSGNQMTIVCWGNTTEVVSKAIDSLNSEEDSLEVIDLRSVSPIDWKTIESSVLKTGRLLVIQEDAEACSIGQSIISRISKNPELFSILSAAPVLISKPDVHIGYNPVLEYSALPDSATVKESIIQLLQTGISRKIETPAKITEHNPAIEKMKESFAETAEKVIETTQKLTVPILGEGITTARVINLIAEAGEAVQEDDPLCEVETDKALFPIESPINGILQDWRVEEGDEIEVHQWIANILCHSDPVEFAAQNEPKQMLKQEVEVPEAENRVTQGGLTPQIIAQLKDVVPAHMTVMAGWERIREVREAAKDSGIPNPPSPTTMVAWAITQAIRVHPIFSCTLNPQGALIQNETFDFGIAVALRDDALDTAVIEDASQLDWDNFQSAYFEAIAAARDNKKRSKAKVPMILTSMGGFSVRDAQPLVVPPAIGTLFLGEAQFLHNADHSISEQVALCLSFDHRWLNGAAGAHFLKDVKRIMENFQL